MKVYVISNEGHPLMPCESVIARLLLKSKRAKVIKREPFTIKLLYETTSYVQKLTLGVDTGSGTIGTAVADEESNVLYMSEVQVRNDISKKMTQRAKYRRNRRNRKTRYRKSRWMNRKNSIKKNRFSPTMTSKLHSHVKEIGYIKSILPITKIVLETGQFDTHLMKNPSLVNPKVKHWGYQKGPNYGFENTKAMVLNRDDYTCQYCHGKHKDSHLEVHHIVFRSHGGSDESENLITLCHTCHKALHDGKIHPNLKGKAKGTLKYATQMNSIRKQLLKIYPEAIETFGYITKANRLNLGVDKEHYYDACVIATQGKDFQVKTALFQKKCVPDGDFQKTKGIRSEQELNTKKIQGFRKFDKVKYLEKEYFIKGRMASGYAVLMDIFGNKIDFSSMPKGFKTPKMKKYDKSTGKVFMDDYKYASVRRNVMKQNNISAYPHTQGYVVLPRKIFINVQPSESLLFLYRLQKAFKNNDCPINGPGLILEKAFGRYIPEENIFYELHLMTGDADFAHKMNSLYETFYKMNPVFRNCALQYIDEAMRKQAPLN